MKMPRTNEPGDAPRRIQASDVPAAIQGAYCDAELDIQAAASEGELPTFAMTLYTGGTLKQYWGKVVVDLKGMKYKQVMPVHWGHDRNRPVGHTTSVTVEGSKILIQGVISGDPEDPDTRRVIRLGKNKFPLQASGGWDVDEYQRLEEEQEAEMNGRVVKGPLVLARKSVLVEGSIVTLGADPNTKTKIAAQAAKETDMDPKFLEWLAARKIDAAKAEAMKAGQAEVFAALEAAWKAETEGGVEDAGAGAQPPAAPGNPGDGADDEIKALRARRVAENKRIEAIESACQPDEFCDDKAKAALKDIRANAIEQGWSSEKAELEALRAKRVAPKPAVHIHEDMSGDEKVVQAAALKAMRAPGEWRKGFDEKTLEAADKLRGFGLYHLVQAAAHAAGRKLPSILASGKMAYARAVEDVIKAAFSGVELADGILSATAYKSLLSAYQAIPSAAKRIARIGRVENFQTHTRYRLTGDAEFEEVGPTGELKHGTLGDDAYTQKAATYGKIYYLTRQDIINDDLGAFADIPMKIGRGAATALEKAFFTLLLSNPSSFFSSGHGNLLEGTAYVLGNGVAALNAALVLFFSQTDADGYPVNIEAKSLLVPPALKGTADELYQSTTFVATGVASSSKREAATNVHAGKYEPVMSPYLSNSNLTGYSSTGWYLFADPQVLPAFEIAFLLGQESPTIESVEPPTDTLGVGFRGYHDWGVKEQDYRGAVFVTGVAAS